MSTPPMQMAEATATEVVKKPLAPAGTPTTIGARLQVAAAMALAASEMRDKLATDGTAPMGSTPGPLRQ
jgi:hypothetical protein